jgi:hypothetical protein
MIGDREIGENDVKHICSFKTAKRDFPIRLFQSLKFILKR